MERSLVARYRQVSARETDPKVATMITKIGDRISVHSIPTVMMVTLEQYQMHHAGLDLLVAFDLPGVNQFSFADGALNDWYTLSSILPRTI